MIEKDSIFSLHTLLGEIFAVRPSSQNFFLLRGFIFADFVFLIFHGNLISRNGLNNPSFVAKCSKNCRFSIKLGQNYNSNISRGFIFCGLCKKHFLQSRLTFLRLNFFQPTLWREFTKVIYIND